MEKKHILDPSPFESMIFHPFPSSGICHDPSLDGTVFRESTIAPKARGPLRSCNQPIPRPKGEVDGWVDDGCTANGVKGSQNGTKSPGGFIREKSLQKWPWPYTILD